MKSLVEAVLLQVSAMDLRDVRLLGHTSHLAKGTSEEVADDNVEATQARATILARSSTIFLDELSQSLRRTRLPDSCSPVFRPNGVSQDEAAPAHARGEAYENSSEYNLMFEYDVTSVILPRPQDRNATCGFNNAERKFTTERRWWVEAKNQDTKSG